MRCSPLNNNPHVQPGDSSQKKAVDAVLLVAYPWLLVVLVPHENFKSSVETTKNVSLPKSTLHHDYNSQVFLAKNIFKSWNLMLLK